MGFGIYSTYGASLVARSFNSRAEAALVPITDENDIICVRTGKYQCFFEHSPTGKALTTLGNKKWRPLRGVPTLLEHYDVVTLPDKETTGTLIDYGAKVQDAIDETDGTLLLTGHVKVNRQINGKVGCKIDTLLGHTRGIPAAGSDPGVEIGGGFIVESGFPMSAKAVLVAPTASRGWTLGNICISFRHLVAKTATIRPTEDAEGDYDYPFGTNRRTLLTNYPPAIDVSNTVTRSIIENVRIEGSRKGIVGIGNCGGAEWGNLEISAFDVAVEIDGPEDYMRVRSIRGWPFGFAGNTNLMSVYTDGNSYALKLGRVDGWQCDALSAFECKVEINHTGTNKLLWLPFQFGMIQMDGGSGHFIHKAGVTAPGSFVSPTIFSMVGGKFTCGNVYFYGGASVNILQTGGTLDLRGIFYARAANSVMARCAGGSMNIEGIADCHVSTRTVPFVQQDTAGNLRSRLRPEPTLAATQPLHAILVDRPANDIENPRYYSMSLPAVATQGRYIQLGATV